MAYDDWKTGGSDPGYDPQNDQPEPEQWPEGIVISADDFDDARPIAADTFGGIQGPDTAINCVSPIFADVTAAARWAGMSVHGTEDCRWFEWGTER